MLSAFLVLLPALVAAFPSGLYCGYVSEAPTATLVKVFFGDHFVDVAVNSGDEVTFHDIATFNVLGRKFLSGWFGAAYELRSHFSAIGITALPWMHFYMGAGETVMWTLGSTHLVYLSEEDCPAALQTTTTARPISTTARPTTTTARPISTTPRPGSSSPAGAAPPPPSPGLDPSGLYELEASEVAGFISLGRDLRGGIVAEFEFGATEYPPVQFALKPSPAPGVAEVLAELVLRNTPAAKILRSSVKELFGSSAGFSKLLWVRQDGRELLMWTVGSTDYIFMKVQRLLV